MDQLLDSKLDQETPQYSDYASFGQRLVAAIIDGVIMYVVQMIIFAVFGLSLIGKTNTYEDGIPTSFWLAYLVLICAQVAYFVVLESSEKQATFGKQAMSIVVTDMNGNRITPLNALGRYFAKIPSGLILGIGYFMQPFTQKKQALHDMIAGTLVYKSVK